MKNDPSLFEIRGTPVYSDRDTVFPRKLKSNICDKFAYTAHISIRTVKNTVWAVSN